MAQFFPARGIGKLKLGEARKAIRDYRKATGDLSGTAELLMTYVENGTRFTREFGDIDERFYSSVESALDELAASYAGRAKVVKVDIDQNQGTALKYHVRSIPMLLLFKDGQVQATQIGAVGKAQLAQMIDKAL